MNSISQEQMDNNKERFISLLEPAVKSRTGANWDGLINKLNNSDFFYAPASTKYHCAYKGGLCQHSLNVYDNLMNLIATKNVSDKISIESATIVSLLHDLGKMDFYRPTVRNVKVYFEAGTKKDELGRYDWVSEPGYMTIPDDEKKMLIGNHEETCEYMVSWFIPLKPEETAAILSHHGGMGYDSPDQTAPKIMNRYLLAALLHIADMLAAYVDEGFNE